MTMNMVEEASMYAWYPGNIKKIGWTVMYHGWIWLLLTGMSKLPIIVMLKYYTYETYS
jgi:hypothetical protein